jgi:hypothetical protein
MPCAKRPLAEADQNASNKSAKILKKVGSRYILESKGNHIAGKENQESKPRRKEKIEYKTKHNSKLRALLYDRDLSTSGSRQELITRLENSSIDYETLPSGQITEMLKRRQITMSSQGSKEVRIERLRLNDKLDRDTGNSQESVLYGRLAATEDVLDDLVAKQEKALGENSLYSAMKPAQLSAHLEKRKLACSGSKTAQITRLQNYDRKTIAKDLEKLRARHDSLKLELESKVGHPVNSSEVLSEENNLRALDIQIQQQEPRRSPVPICDYKWQDSHWAGRTERELTEICSRREMPGCGPKAAMIKWLDTGVVEYEDLYTSGLENICRQRGVPCKSKDKKDDLIRRLREADEIDE